MPVKKAIKSSPNMLLRKARQERGWSQKELADLIGVPQPFMISRWENGTARPGPAYRKKLSSIFDKKYEELGLHIFVSQVMPEETQTPAPTSIIDPTIPVRQPGAPTLIGRDLLLAQIKRELCSDKNDIFIGINGLPGVGKTALTREIVTDTEVQEHFSDGVLWATLGPQPDLSTHLQRWGNLLGIKASDAANLQGCTAWIQALRQAIGARQILFVLDDFWHIEDALTFMIGNPRCAYLLTTRVPEVATRFAGKQAIHVPELTIDTSMQLLGQMIPVLIEQERPVLSQLALAAGGLPLILTLIGNYLLIHVRHRQQRRIQHALMQLQRPEARMWLIQPQARTGYDQNIPTDMPLNVQTIISMSETLLDTSSRQALYALSVFPAKPATFSEEAALAVTATSRDALDRLIDAGLIECNEEDRYQLHPSIVDYARIQATNTQAERRFVAYVFAYIRKHMGDKKLLEQEASIILAALKIISQERYNELLECSTKSLVASGIDALLGSPVAVSLEPGSGN
ncbi:MAG: helix-turn-helix domain-containing protein [Ktedonobacteraceae bacterium]|nr:helix-turn-helix domain-containing protein [Ktedonobacteraceae bacterium]